MELVPTNKPPVLNALNFNSLPLKTASFSSKDVSTTASYHVSCRTDALLDPSAPKTSPNATSLPSSANVSHKRAANGAESTNGSPTSKPNSTPSSQRNIAPSSNASPTKPTRETLLKGKKSCEKKSRVFWGASGQRGVSRKKLVAQGVRFGVPLPGPKAF